VLSALGASGAPVAASQPRTTLSAPAATSTPIGERERPDRAAGQRQVAQHLPAPGLDERRLPVDAAHSDQPVVDRERDDRDRTGRDLPQHHAGRVENPQHAVRATGPDPAFCVDRERVLHGRQCQDRPWRPGGVPQAQRRIVARAREPATGKEGDRVDRPGMAIDPRRRAATGGMQEHDPVPAAGRDARTVRRHGDRRHRPVMPTKQPLGRRPLAPERHLPVLPARHEPPVAKEGHGVDPPECSRSTRSATPLALSQRIAVVSKDPVAARPSGPSASARTGPPWPRNSIAATGTAASMAARLRTSVRRNRAPGARSRPHCRPRIIPPWRCVRP
jgi:hypothetical protein